MEANTANERKLSQSNFTHFYIATLLFKPNNKTKQNSLMRQQHKEQTLIVPDVIHNEILQVRIHLTPIVLSLVSQTDSNKLEITIPEQI